MRVAEAAESLPSDVILVACDGSSHPAHRLVLSARSPFFLKMLSSGMREQSTGQVQLPDVDPQRLEAMLAWMYGREAMVNLDSAAEALSLLELAKRWEMSELCEQLSSCEFCTLADTNVLTVWEAAQRLSLDRLEVRCRDFVMAQLAELAEQGDGGFPAGLRHLSAVQFRSILESDELPVLNEEKAFNLALKYIELHKGSLTVAEVDELLLAVRWRLVSGPTIAERAMRHPLFHDTEGGVRTRLLRALADGMQFQFLGGKAWTMMPPSPAGTLRRSHHIPVQSFAALAPGMTVRVISDVEELRKLCKRCAPGAKLKVEWIAELKHMVGVTCTVKELRDEICGVQVEDAERVDRYLPFDALLLA